MRAKECAKFLGIGLSTFWRWVRIGRIPEGIHLSARCTVWTVEEMRGMVTRPQAARKETPHE
jgi:predicted DNA-binding transcriptional regulator AlpA